MKYAQLKLYIKEVCYLTCNKQNVFAADIFQFKKMIRSYIRYSLEQLLEELAN